MTGLIHNFPFSHTRSSQIRPAIPVRVVPARKFSPLDPKPHSPDHEERLIKFFSRLFLFPSNRVNSGNNRALREKGTPW